MFLGLDPDSTFDHELPGQEGTPPAERVRLTCRFLTVRTMLKVRSELKAIADATSGDAYLAAVLEALRTYVAEVHGLPDSSAEGVDGLCDVLTMTEMHLLVLELGGKQALTEFQRKNSAPQQPGSPAQSAVGAGTAAAT